MSLRTSRKTTTTSYRTMNASSPEQITAPVITTRSVSPIQTVQNGGYETVRYLVPMQQPVQQQQYMLMPQPMMPQPMMQSMVQCVSPVYLQGMPRLSVSSQESELMYLQQPSIEVSGAGEYSFFFF